MYFIYRGDAEDLYTLFIGVRSGYPVLVSRWLACISMQHMEGFQRLQVMACESFLGAHEVCVYVCVYIHN